LDGKALLHMMHAHEESLVYWLEFKNGDEFPRTRLGSILGGSAHKFASSAAPIRVNGCLDPRRTSKTSQKAEVINVARSYREQHLSGIDLREAVPEAADDAAYLELQRALGQQAPEIFGLAWAKY
jgi:hypothetical protein